MNTVRRFATAIALVALGLTGLGARHGLILAAHAASTSDVIIGPGAQGSDISAFGYPDTATYGETITSPGGLLKSFTFWVSLPAGLEWQGEVYAWDTTSTRAVGPALWESPVVTATGGTHVPVTFTTTGVPTTAGQHYVLFGTISKVYSQDYGKGAGSWSFNGNASTYSGGDVYWENNESDVSQWTGRSWDKWIGGDLGFTADFGPAVTPVSLSGGVTSAPAKQGASIVTNGDFSSGTLGTYGGGSTAVTGWTVTGNSVDFCNCWSGPNGQPQIDLNGNAPGGISQTLTTVAGQTYELTFALAANTGSGSAPYLRTVEVAAGSTSQTFLVDQTYAAGNGKWLYETMPFTATGTSTPLSFTSLDAGCATNPGCASGPAIAAVNVSTFGSWYRTTPVGVHWTCSSAAATCPGNSSLTSDGAGMTVSASVSGAYVGTGTLSGINIDSTAPTFSCASPDGAWHATEVTLSCTAQDSGSGFDGPAPVLSLSTNVGAGNQTSNAVASTTSQACDQVGNCATPASIAGNKVDEKAPTASVSATSAGSAYVAGRWVNADVTVTATCDDGADGSGAANPTNAQTVSTEGPNQTSSAVTCADNVGNKAAPVSFTGISIDKTPPVFAPSIPSAASNGWYNISTGAPTVAWNCSDPVNASNGTAGSGLASCSDPFTFGEGLNQQATANAADVAGNTNSTSVSGINVDLTAPTITYTGNKGSYGILDTVAITCTAADPAGSDGFASGVASSTCKNVAGAAYSFTPGTNSYSASVADVAGNTGAGSTSFTVTATFTDLCTLTKQFTTDSNEANSLCVKLKNAAAAAARGDKTAQDNILNAYLNELKAQTGKTFTAANAAILTTWAKTLL